MRGGEEEKEEQEEQEEQDDEVPQLHLTLRHLDSLISLSSTIKSFPGKWHPINLSLHSLRSLLPAAASAANSPLLAALNATLAEAHLLAGLCAAAHFPAGKLLTKSNLDLLSSKLHLHRQSLDEILAQKLLTEKSIVLFKPPRGSPREEMKLYVKDLHSRMKLPDPEMAARALSSLNEILSEDEKYVRIATVEFPEVVGLLLRLLESEAAEVQREASMAVSTISSLPVYRPLLALAGGVASLSRVLEAGGAAAKEEAARALQRLTENCDNSWAASAHGGVAALLRICADARARGGLLAAACAALRNLAAAPQIRRFIVERGAVGSFLRLSESPDELAQLQGMEFLRFLAAADAAAKEVIIAEGGMESLMKFFDSCSESSSSVSAKSVEAALKAAEAICFSPASSAAALIRMGFLSRLLGLVGHGEAEVKQAAVKIAASLCASSEEANREMGEMGFIPELVRMLTLKSMEAREAAAEALAVMARVKKNRRRFLKEEDGVSAVVLLLDSEERPRAAEFGLAVILEVCGSREGRKKIVQSGGVERVRKLADMEVEDAKRIVKKLSSGRLQSLLAGFWT